jgi:hypothetical protein
MVLKQQVKFQRLTAQLEKDLGELSTNFVPSYWSLDSSRKLTDQEDAQIHWFCGQDMETYEVFKGLFAELKGGES